MRVAPVLLASLCTITMATVAAITTAAQAEVTHVVQSGHTLEAIAHRYHVTVQAIVEANHLKDTAHLKPGQRLVIPVDESESGHVVHGADRGREHDHGTASFQEAPEPREHGRRGIIHAVRLDEEMHVRVKDGVGHIPGAALRAFEHLMRQGEATHAPDPRLVALVGIVSDHFGGRPIEVVSGFRAYTPTQYTPHSNHNLGRALDFRIRGVKNEELWTFCRTLRSAGCGYYPNSTFVHLDVREAKTFWIDRSRPGEPPQYDRPGVRADEGASEVPDERGPAGHAPGAPSTSQPASIESGAGGNEPTKGSPPPPPSDPATEKSL
jgi:uncharacterized protein YcbK (DUF882 family)